MARLYYVERVHTGQNQTQILNPYLSTGQESTFESVPESVFGNVNEPLGNVVEDKNCFHMVFQHVFHEILDTI